MNTPRFLTRNAAQGEVTNPPAVRHRSQAAADAAAHEMFLEQELKVALSERDEWRRKAEASDDANNNLRLDLSTLKAERDYYQVRCIAIQTKLVTAGEIIMDAMKDPRGADQYAPKGQNPRSADRADEAGAEAMKQLTSDDLPRVIRQGPHDPDAQ